MRPLLIILWTIALDFILFVLNLFVAVLSNSHAVLSQAVYNVTDLVGGVMILWGSVASRRPPDHDHPFGFGKERFFWAFTASLVTFTTAGLIVIASAIQQIVSPSPVDHLPYALLVIGATLAVSIIGIWITMRELGKDRTTLLTLLESSHQGLKTIFYQDLVSVFGSVVAFAGVAVVYFTHSVLFDGLAAGGVGILLVITGFVLAAESRELLIGKAVSPEQAREILMLAERDSRVRQVRSLQTMMLGPEDILVAIRINFQDNLTTDQIERAIDEVGHTVRGKFPAVRHLVIEPES